jgi:mannose-1-phosphate guanylyltransferase
LISSNRRQEYGCSHCICRFAADPDDILIITPSDHIIDDMEAYETAIQEAVEKAAQGYIVTLGLCPLNRKQDMDT